MWTMDNDFYFPIHLAELNDEGEILGDFKIWVCRPCGALVAELYKERHARFHHIYPIALRASDE